MLVRNCIRIAANAGKRTVAVRSFAALKKEDLAHTTHEPQVVDPSKGKDVVFPRLVDTLEWVLDSPPNVHQFEEPPLIVEIAHLNNLKEE